jgi:hypothetical protein
MDAPTDAARIFSLANHPLNSLETRIFRGERPSASSLRQPGWRIVLQMRRAARTFSVGAFVVAFAGVAGAETPQTEPIRLEYRGAPECPSANEFNRAVFSRTTRAHLAETEPAARTFVVVLERAGSGFAGSLAVREAEGTTTSREVKGADCGEVAQALALATSLAIDPNASLAPEPATSTTPPPPEKPKPPESQPRKTPPDRDGAKGAASGGAWEAALGPGVALAIGPRPAFGGALKAGYFSGKPSAALSSFGLELTFLATLPKTVETASSTFWFTFARPELCSMGVGTNHMALLPCLGAELGAVTGRGSDIADAATRTRFWAALDVGPRMRAVLSDTWFFEADARLLVPLVRYEFVFRDPDTTVHRVPALGGLFGVKLGASFR